MRLSSKRVKGKQGANPVDDIRVAVLADNQLTAGRWPTACLSAWTASLLGALLTASPAPPLTFLCMQSPPPPPAGNHCLQQGHCSRLQGNRLWFLLVRHLGPRRHSHSSLP